MIIIIIIIIIIMIYICFSALSTYDVQKHFKESQWTVVMVEWSKALPLTACCLSPLPEFEYHPGDVEELTVTWGLGRVFPRLVRFAAAMLTTGWSRIAAKGRRKLTINRNFQFQFRYLCPGMCICALMVEARVNLNRISGNHSWCSFCSVRVRIRLCA